MFADGFVHILKEMGQEAEICRRGAVVSTTSALPRDKEPCLEFLPGTDIQAGDVVRLVVSEKQFSIERVERYVVGKELMKLKAFFVAAPKQVAAAFTVNGSIISARDIVNSAIQSHSPGATQNLNLVSPASHAKDQAKEAIRLVLEVLDELDLDTEEMAEVKADAESAEAQLKSPKTKWGHVKDILVGIREKVKKGIAKQTGELAVSKANAALEWLNQALTTSGGA